MGIISDFLNLKQQVEENVPAHQPIRRYFLRINKEHLFFAAEKLLNANEPLARDEVLELAQSLHGLALGFDDGYITPKVSVKYFSGAEYYQIKLFSEVFKGTDVRSFEILVSNKLKNLELLVEYQESEEVVKTYRFTSPTIHTNIKELKDFISICNHEVYVLIYQYIIGVLNELP